MIQLQIETSGYCNAKCLFCPYSKVRRDRGFMDMDLFKKIIDEASTSDKFFEVQLTGLGEGLLDKRLEERIKYVREKMPGVEVGIYTNGTHLTPERIDSLDEAGLSYAVVSLNAVNAEQRKRVMDLDDWSQVEKNLEYAFNRNGNLKIEVHAISGTEEFVGEDHFAFYKKYGNANEGGRGLIIREGNWSGDNRHIRDCDVSKCCPRAIGQIYIMWDGRVATCCFDPYGKQIFGDLNTQTLQEVYGSDKYVQFREDHWNDRADRYELCAGCNRI